MATPAKLLLSLVALAGTARADDAAKSTKPPKGCGGEMKWRELAGLGAQALLPPGHFDKLGEGDKTISHLYEASDDSLEMRFSRVDDVPDVKKAKAAVEADASSTGRKVKWTRADKTSDGYALVYLLAAPPRGMAMSVYVADYVRTIDSTKIACHGWGREEAAACAAYVCEQMTSN